MPISVTDQTTLKPEPNPEFTSLQRESVRGGAIALSSQAVMVGIQLVSTVVLARLLTPEDYGVMGMVMSFTVFAALFKDLGLSSAAIQKKDLNRAQQSNLFWLNAGFGLILTVVVAAMAPVVAWFYDRSELVGMTWILSLNVGIGALSAQHGAMLVRNMHFGLQAAANISSLVTTFVVSVVLALLGFSYWSLAWGFVAGSLTRTVLVWFMSPFVPRKWQKNVGTKELLGFGANVTAFNFVNYFSRNLDNILIGKLLGAEILGTYSRAYQLLMIPINNINSPITNVAFPALSKLDPHSEGYRAYYQKLARVICLITMPVVGLLFLLSDDIVKILLGEKWFGVSSIFSILALVAFIQPVASLRGVILLSSGQSSRYFRLGLIGASLTSLSFIIGINIGGVEGLAYSYAVSVWLLFYPMFLLSIKNTAIKPLDLAKEILPPASATIISGLVFLAIKAAVEKDGIVMLGVISIIFFIVYLIVIILIFRKSVFVVKNFWPNVRRNS